MKKKEKLSKAHYSKNLRRVLLRHQTDLTTIQFNASSHSVSLSGKLLKNTGAEFSIPNIIELQKELSSLGHITTDLSNWLITNDSIAKIERDHNQNKKEKQLKKDDEAA